MVVYNQSTTTLIKVDGDGSGEHNLAVLIPPVGSSPPAPDEPTDPVQGHAARTVIKKSGTGEGLGSYMRKVFGRMDPWMQVAVRKTFGVTLFLSLGVATVLLIMAAILIPHALRNRYGLPFFHTFSRARVLVDEHQMGDDEILYSDDRCVYKHHFKSPTERTVIHDFRYRWSALVDEAKGQCLLFHIAEPRLCRKSYPFDLDSSMGLLTPTDSSAAPVKIFRRISSQPVRVMDCAGPDIERACRELPSYIVYGTVVQFNYPKGQIAEAPEGAERLTAAKAFRQKRELGHAGNAHVETVENSDAVGDNVRLDPPQKMMSKGNTKMDDETSDDASDFAVNVNSKTGLDVEIDGDPAEHQKHESFGLDKTTPFGEASETAQDQGHEALETELSDTGEQKTPKDGESIAASGEGEFDRFLKGEDAVPANVKGDEIVDGKSRADVKGESVALETGGPSMLGPVTRKSGVSKSGEPEIPPEAEPSVGPKTEPPIELDAEPASSMKDGPTASNMGLEPAAHFKDETLAPKEDQAATPETHVREKNEKYRHGLLDLILFPRFPWPPADLKNPKRFMMPDFLKPKAVPVDFINPAQPKANLMKDFAEINEEKNKHRMELLNQQAQDHPQDKFTESETMGAEGAESTDPKVDEPASRKQDSLQTPPKLPKEAVGDQWDLERAFAFPESMPKHWVVELPSGGQADVDHGPTKDSDGWIQALL